MLQVDATEFCALSIVWGCAGACDKGRGRGYQRPQVSGRITERAKLTFTEVGTLGNRCTWERSYELRLDRSGPLRGLLPATALATTGRVGGALTLRGTGQTHRLG